MLIWQSECVCGIVYDSCVVCLFCTTLLSHPSVPRVQAVQDFDVSAERDCLDVCVCVCMCARRLYSTGFCLHLCTASSALRSGEFRACLFYGVFLKLEIAFMCMVWARFHPSCCRWVHALLILCVHVCMGVSEWVDG